MKSIIQTDTDKCFNCRQAFGAEWHHIFGGWTGNRDKSEADGLKIRLCKECHEKTHSDPEESGPLQEKWHRLGQTQWEATYGWQYEDPRQAFRERYGKSWL